MLVVHVPVVQVHVHVHAVLYMCKNIYMLYTLDLAVNMPVEVHVHVQK